MWRCEPCTQSIAAWRWAGSCHEAGSEGKTQIAGNGALVTHAAPSETSYENLLEAGGVPTATSRDHTHTHSQTARTLRSPTSASLRCRRLIRNEKAFLTPHPSSLRAPRLGGQAEVRPHPWGEKEARERGSGDGRRAGGAFSTPGSPPSVSRPPPPPAHTGSRLAGPRSPVRLAPYKERRELPRAGPALPPARGPSSSLRLTGRDAGAAPNGDGPAARRLRRPRKSGVRRRGAASPCRPSLPSLHLRAAPPGPPSSRPAPRGSALACRKGAPAPTAAARLRMRAAGAGAGCGKGGLWAVCARSLWRM